MSFIRNLAIVLVLVPAIALSSPMLTIVYPPEGSRVNLNETTYIFAYSNETLDAVTINITYPIAATGNMVFDGTYWRYSLVPDKKSVYVYEVNGSNANGTASDSSYFYAESRNETIIDVEVLPSCTVGISDADIPKRAKMNKDYVVKTWISDLGNIHLYETPLAYVLDKYNNKVGIFVVNSSFSPDCPGNTTRLEMFDTYSNGTPLYMTDFSCFWKAIVNEYGDYRYVVEVNYSSLNKSQTAMRIPLLYQGRDCGNETSGMVNCTKTVERCRYDIIGVAEIVNLTTESSATVSDMDTNYTAYEGIHKGYNVYSFKLKSCDTYCYVCMSDDTNITEASECGKEGEIIQSSLYLVNSISFDGKTVDLRKAEKRCETTDINYTCMLGGGFADCNLTAYCRGIARKETPFKIPEPAKIVIIREKPEHVYQTPDNSLRTRIKTILFNRGDTTAWHVNFTDNITGVCSYDCSIMDFSCSSEYNVSCSYELNGSVRVNLSTIPEMKPKDYVIIEYTLVQSNNTNLYLSSLNHYFLNGTVTYYIPIENRTVVSGEDDPDINTDESRKIYFINDSYFDYNLDIDLANNITDRYFSSNKNTTVRVYALFNGRDKPGWNITFSAPDAWVLNNCTSPSCDCSVNNTAKTVVCSSNSTIRNGDEIYFDISFRSLSETYFLTPLTDDEGVQYYYRPGLFSLSRPITQKNLNNTKGNETAENSTQTPQPQPQPQPRPQPQPEPGYQEKPGESGRADLLIVPAKPEWEGYQEEWIPVVINVTNIGDVPLYNITIYAYEPIYGDRWEYFNATISSLDVNETTNRTIFIKPSYLVPPGKYTVIVKGSLNGTVLDVNYFTVLVKEGRNLTRLEIVEYPLLFGIRSESNGTIPILLKNTGKIPLTGITARIENYEDCLAGFASDSINLTVNETGTLEINVSALVGPSTCNATIIISTNEKHYEVIPIIIRVSPPLALFPFGISFYPILLAAYNLALFFMIRREKRMKKVPRNYDSMIKAMFVVDFLLISYAVLWYLGYVKIF